VAARPPAGARGAPRPPRAAGGRSEAGGRAPPARCPSGRAVGRAPPAGARVSRRETSRTPLAVSRTWTGLWFPGILASLQFLTEK